MLDEEHDDYERDPNSNDQNLYILGSIAGHNVAIGYLPAGQIGTNSAAAVATQMQATFSGIRFGLMVGVGGGVPSSEADIRLGDVVVSQPDQTFGGVVQYDMGKNTPGGFIRTGLLNTPPKMLLGAVTRVRSNHLIGVNKLSQYMSRLEHIPRFQRHNTGPDILFQASYDHEGGPTCESCDLDRQEPRHPRGQEDEVTVHYGTIASGNQVIKNAEERDRVSGYLGGVLCFEMEAAGLMNYFPCLVVRGICDYSDSHKHKSWQPYAAATAAAWAKELLSVVPKSEVHKEDTVYQVVRRASTIGPPSQAHHNPQPSNQPPKLPQWKPAPPLLPESTLNQPSQPSQYTYQAGANVQSTPWLFNEQSLPTENMTQQFSQVNLSTANYRYNPTPTPSVQVLKTTSTEAVKPQPNMVAGLSSQLVERLSENIWRIIPTLKPKKFRDPNTFLTAIRSDSRYMKSLANNNPIFHNFVMKANVQDVKVVLEVLLKSGLNPNDPQYVGNYEDQQGANPHMWILHDNWRVVGPGVRFQIFQLLVAHGADVVNFEMKNGRTALHRACGLGLIDVVRHILSRGANVNSFTQFGYPLHVATMGNQSAVIELLATHGAFVNMKTTMYDQPILEAAYRGYKNAAMSLLRSGADVNAKVTVHQQYAGITPLMFCVYYGRLQLATHILREYGQYVEVNAKSNHGRSAMHMSLAAWQTVDKMTRTKMVQLFLNHGASPNSIDNSSYHILHVAARFGLAQAILDLIKHGARQSLEITDSHNNTPILWAAGCGHTDAVEVLVWNGANLRPWPGHCKTALEVARIWQQKEMVLFLMNKYPYEI